ncbi:MAG TPA: 50S ribosomal protein L31 [Campylobacterales bacterium]|nr:50S ribosomal protein L31 [Campylobacterales bacterium]
MKKGIHPEYVPARVICACGNEFETMSIKPEIKIDICGACHPFYTGSQKVVDTTGRIEKFNKKYQLK